LITLLAFLLSSIAIGLFVISILYLLRSHGKSALKKFHFTQFLFTIGVVAFVNYRAAQDIKINPLDGPGGAFQGMEAGLATLLGIGSQIVIFVCLPWLLSKAPTK
jgi:hypothetical protein